MSKFAVRGLVQSLGKLVPPIPETLELMAGSHMVVVTCICIQTAQELREHGICVNGYAPGTIQTDLGTRSFSLAVSVFFPPFEATEAEKVAGDKTVQEVSRSSPHAALGWVSQ